MSVMNTVATLHQVDQEQVEIVVREMTKVLGSLSAITLSGQDVLVGVFIRPGSKKIRGANGQMLEFHIGGTGAEAVEDIFQGKIVRILKLGPQAFCTKTFPRLLDEWGHEDNLPKVGDWVAMKSNDGIQVSYKGPGSESTDFFKDMQKVPSNGGWPCRIVSFSDIIVKVSDPAVLV